MVKALSPFVQMYRDHSDFDDNTLADELGRRQPLALMGQARANSATVRTALVRTLCESFLSVYNHNRQRLLPPSGSQGGRCCPDPVM